MKILIISNGFGEDFIAGNLSIEFQKQLPEAKLLAFPLVGSGFYYKKIGLDPAWKNPEFPSGGFIRNISDFVIDLKSGLLSHIGSQINELRKIGRMINLTVCVGDVFCLALSGLTSNAPRVFLPTAKSDLISPHSNLESWLIKKWAAHVFPRDEITAKNLKNRGIPAEYLGNPMFDELQNTHETFGLNVQTPVIGILPGSRQECYKNLDYCLDIAENLWKEKPDLRFLISVSPSFSILKFLERSKRSWSVTEKPNVFRLTSPIGFSFITTPLFSDVVTRSSVIIGLAGTANEQAVYMGKPVISFEGFGPQSTLVRFKEQKKLLGDKLTVIEIRDPHVISKAVLDVFQKNPISASKLSFPLQNASQKIVKHICALNPFWI